MEVNIKSKNGDIKVELNEYDIVGDILKKSNNGEIVINQVFNKYNLIYENMILNVEKHLKFYKIRSNDSIYMGYVEDYLQENEIIVEIILQFDLSESIFLIIDRNDKISDVKELIRKLIPEHSKVNVFDQDHKPIKENTNVKHFYKGDSKRKIFMSWNEKTNYADLYHGKLITTYFWFGPENENWGNKYTDKDRQYVKNLREIITYETPDPILLVKLTENKKLLKGSRFPICKIYSESLYEICEKYVDQYNARLSKSDFPAIYRYIRLALMIMIEEKMKQNKKNLQNSSLGQILLDALGLLENRATDGSIIMKSFVKKFFLRNFKSENFNTFRRNYLENYAVINLSCSKFTEHLQIPLGKRTLEKLKELTSWHFGISTNDLYFVCFEMGSIKESDKINITKNMTIHFRLILQMDGTVQKHEEGSFGEVLLYHTSNESFALKLNKESDILERDINIQSDLKFSKILVTFKDLYHYNDQVAFNMEYIEGMSLANYIKNFQCSKNRKESFLPEETIFKISFNILQQIDEIHKMKIAHRDIKSENVVLDKNLNAKLIDFGLSKSINNVSEEELQQKLQSYIRGTIGYMAPELLQLKPYSTMIDIWSFGVMLIEMITGNENNNLNVSLKVKENKFDYKLPPKCSSEIQEFVDLCLKMSPDERWSAKQLLTCEFIKKFNRN